MKLTRASSYALNAVAYMAAGPTPEKPVASHMIAAAKSIPERFLLKVLKPLVSARVLLSIKGPNGGYRLAKPASQITMEEIIRAVDGPIEGNAPITQENNGPINARLRAICEHSAELVREHLKNIHITDLVTIKVELPSSPTKKTKKTRE